MSESNSTSRLTPLLLTVVMIPQLGLSLLNPSILQMSNDLRTPVSAIQLTLTCYMAGYALSMFLSGVLADRFDASKLQALGLLLFSIGSVVCAVSPNVWMLGVGRLAQAIGGTSATVLCRLVIQRRWPVADRLGILTSLSVVIAATPAISPLLGGGLATWAPWRALFVALAVAASVISFVVFLRFPDARPQKPINPSLQGIAAGIGEALSSNRFRWFAIAIGSVWMSYFGFIEQSATLLQDILGNGPMAYGSLMVIPALGYIAGSLVAKRLKTPARAAPLGVCAGLCGAIVLVVVNLGDGLPGVVVVLPLVIQFFWGRCDNSLRPSRFAVAEPAFARCGGRIVLLHSDGDGRCVHRGGGVTRSGQCAADFGGCCSTANRFGSAVRRVPPSYEGRELGVSC